MTERMENALRHIKTSVDVDPWAVEEVERVFKAYEQTQPLIEQFKEMDDREKIARILAMALEQPQDGDLISRQAAIEAICKVCDVMSEKEQNINCPYYFHGCKEIRVLRELPPVTPSEDELTDAHYEGYKEAWNNAKVKYDRPTGHWILKHRNINKIEYHTGNDVLTDEVYTVKELIRYETNEPYCSECGKRADDISQEFCGYCGSYNGIVDARMVGDTDGN